MRSSELWSSVASRCCVLFVTGLVIVLCTPVRTAPTGAEPSPADTPLTLAVAAALTAPSALSAPSALPARVPVGTDEPVVTPTSPTTPRSVDALTARLVDGRARAALPRILDLGAIRAAAISAHDTTLRTASIFGEQRDTAPNAADKSVTGAAVAFGAPDAGKRGGVGPSSFSTSGSGGSATATLSGLSELAVHDGLTVARDTTRTGTIHASIQPLDRPG